MSKNLPANAGDTGLIPDPGREHLSSCTKLLSPDVATTEVCAPRACAPKEEEPVQWEAHASQQRVALPHCN